MRAQLKQAEQANPGQGQADAAQYITRFRDFKYYETLFDLFARQYELARVDEAKDGALIQVVDAAVVPEYKSKPKRGLIAVLATLLALVVCTIWVLASHALAQYGRRPEGTAKLNQLRLAIRGRSAP